MQLLVKLAITGAIMGVLDAIWLTLIANKFYKSQLAPLLLERPNMVAAISFYVIYVIGVVMFVLTPALEKNSWQHALGYGVLFGLVAYATYDLTNLATLKSWPLKLVVVDLIWGAALTGVVSLLAFLAVRAWTL